MKQQPSPEKIDLFKDTFRTPSLSDALVEKLTWAVQKKQDVNKRAIPVYTEMALLFNSTGGLPLTTKNNFP